MPTATQTESKTSKKIDVREATAAAFQYFQQLFSPAEIRSVSLEEVELSEDDKHWLITLGYEFGGSKATIAAALYGPPKTKYKVFKVDTKTGRVVAMKIRKLE